MKKKNFAVLVMGTIGALIFGVGMCMCLLPEWNAFDSGLVIGGIGFIVLIATVIAACGNAKRIGTVLLGIIGSLLLGAGMCCAMIWNSIVIGILVGLIGIVALLSLIPMVKGFK